MKIKKVKKTFQTVTFKYESSLRPGEFDQGTIETDSGGVDLKITLWGGENEHSLFHSGTMGGLSDYVLVSTAPDDGVDVKRWSKKIRFSSDWKETHRRHNAFTDEVIEEVAKIVGRFTTPQSIKNISGALRFLAERL